MSPAELFSMEKYAEGFVEVCEQLGVDPAELVKAAQALTPEQKRYGRAYRPGVQEQFRYGDELGQARRWEMAKGTPARAGMFARGQMGHALSLGGGGMGDLQIPMVRGVAAIAGSSPVQFLKGFFGGSDERRAPPAAPAATPAPGTAVPGFEEFKRQAQLQPFGGDFYERRRRAEEIWGPRWDQGLRMGMRRPWYARESQPAAPKYIRRPDLS
jgi:hypothetical protein